MNRQWSEQELGEQWSLTHDEFEPLKNRTVRSRLGFATLFKFFLLEGRFPRNKREVPSVALQYLAEQLDVNPNEFDSYNLLGRTAKRDRESIRVKLGVDHSRLKIHQHYRLGYARPFCHKTTSRNTFTKRL